MKVRALTSFAGLGFSYSTGQVFDLPPGKERWLANGWVEALPLERETAATEPPERAEMPRPKRKRAGGEA